MNNYQRLSKSILSVFILLVATRCAASASPIKPTPTNPIITPTLVPTQTTTVPPSPTQSFVSTPTASLFPTADPSDVSDYLLSLYAKDDCDVPCWWGIIPGKTTWADMYEEVSRYGVIYGPSTWKNVEGYAIEFSVTQDNFTELTVRYRLWVQDGVVLAIGTNSGLITLGADNSLAEQLKKYGQPEEVWLSSIHFGGLQPSAYINLFYPSKGLWMFWISKAVENGEKRLTICPNNRTREYKNINFFLFSSESQMTFEKAWDVATGRLDEKLGKYGPYGRLEKFANDFNTEKFYQTYLDPQATQCFEIGPTK